MPAEAQAQPGGVHHPQVQQPLAQRLPAHPPLECDAIGDGYHEVRDDHRGLRHVDAKHPNCAYKWLEHSLSPKLQGDLASWFGSVPTVPTACKGNALLTDTGCATNGYENFGKIWFWRCSR